MDTRLLKIFACVAKHGALPAASREMHLTVSALSRSLKALETHLGARLFDRVGRKLLLNQAGEQLLLQIQDPLAALERAATSIKGLGKWGQGRLRVGAPATLCQHLFPKVIQELQRVFSRLHLVVECGEGADLLQLLRQNRIDLVLCIEPEPAPDLESRPLFEDELLFAFAGEHPWADGRALSPEEIGKQPILLSKRTTPTAQMTHKFFSDQRIELMTVLEIGHIGMIKELVKLQVAAAVLAPWVFEQELATGHIKMRPLGRKPLRRQWSVVYRAQTRLGLAEEEFVKMCRRRVTALRLDRKDLPPASQVRLK